MQNNHQVVIAGAGPTGLMLAGELALAGIETVLVERRSDRELVGWRAGGLHARSIEILDQRGIAGRFLAEGQISQIAGFAWTPLDIDDFPTRHNYGLALWQNRIEHHLADWVDALHVPVHRGCAVTGFEQNQNGVAVALSDGRSLRADYLIGCDGGRSLVRKMAGIDFPGWDPSLSNLMAEVEMTEEPSWGLRHDALGFHGLSRSENGLVRVLLTERELQKGSEPDLGDLREAMMAVYGTHFGVHSPRWISRFTDTARQAASYRKGRIFLAGDAAHIHHSVGGQGLNTGVQDAVNLGWKLAQVIKGVSPESLLDSYHNERHPVGARVLRNTMAQMALLRRAEPHLKAARDCVSELLGFEDARKQFAAMMSGLDIRYDIGEGHPLIGRRMPDLDLETDSGPARVYTLLHEARPLLLDFGCGLDIAPWADRVRHVDARYEGAWELPVLGMVAAPGAVLVRPDGYVAWTGDQNTEEFATALTAWFGPPAGR